MKFITRVFCCLGLALLVGCGATDLGDAVSIRVESSSPTVSKERPIALSISLVNQTGETVRIPVHCGPHFDVLASDGTRVGPPGRICTAALYPPIELPPFGRRVISDWWAGDGEQTDPSAPHPWEGAPLPSGTYSIVARMPVLVGDEMVSLSTPPLPTEVVQNER